MPLGIIKLKVLVLSLGIEAGTGLGYMRKVTMSEDLRIGMSLLQSSEQFQECTKNELRIAVSTVMMN